MSVNFRDFMDDAMSFMKDLANPDSEIGKRRQWMKERNMSIDQEGQQRLEEIKNSGALARQRLMNEGDIASADIAGKANIASANAHAGATEFSALQGTAGHRLAADAEKYKADQIFAGAGKGLTGEKIKGSVALLNDPATSDEDKKSIGRNLRAMLSEGQQRDATSFDSATPSSPGGNATPIAPGPARAAVGGKSMTFNTEENPMAVTPRKKKVKTSEDYLFNR